jgi:calcyclin binding protein
MTQEVKANIDELQFLLSQSKQPAVRSLLEGELKRQNELLKTVAPPEKKPIVKSGVRTKKITNYSWEENLKYVKVHVRDIKGAEDVIDKENIDAKFELRSFNVILRKVGPKGLNYSLAIGNLKKDIVPEECKVVPTKTGVTVHLFKDKNSMWTDLKLQKDEKKDDMPKMDKDADPSAGLMNLMKHMYETGDDEMKRTIAKSMYEAQNKQGSGEASKLPDMGDMGAGFDDL